MTATRYYTPIDVPDRGPEIGEHVNAQGRKRTLIGMRRVTRHEMKPGAHYTALRWTDETGRVFESSVREWNRWMRGWSETISVVSAPLREQESGGLA